MKSTKTIAALCAATMALSTMALPVQAKTSKNTEVITMDDTVKPSKSKKSTKAATDEYKDFGKDLKVTAHTPEDITKAYLYAHMMCAKSLTVTLADDYKMLRSDIYSELGGVLRLIASKYWDNRVDRGEMKDIDKKTIMFTEFGDIMSYFTYVYRTGDTNKIPKNYDKLYERLADGVDSCTADVDSITDVADNICDWLINNTDRSTDKRYSFKGVIGKSSIRRTSAGKMILNCEGYSYMFMTMMRMAGYTAYNVSGVSPNGINHAWNAIRVGDEYRYYDAGWTSTPDNMTYKEMLKEGYSIPDIYYRDTDYGIVDFKYNPTQKEVEAQFIDWH